MTEDRNVIYENQIRAYMFKRTLERHKKICKQLNVIPNLTEYREKLILDEFKEGR